ncbi:MAG TPA: tripartite tricarboxylate transporter TctB family protein [Noviherbaspirillum sp.]|nr:tripartite tricarboxylate transporter TctB family protein [Noviherbaspirillum sp.]
MKRLNINQVLAILIAALSFAYLFEAYRIPTFPIPRPVDSDVLPKVLGFLMLGLSVWLFFERPKGAAEGEIVEERGVLERWLPVAVTAVAIAVYAGALAWLGFVLASFLLVGGLTWYYGYRRHIVNAIVALAVPLVLYLSMTRLMDIHLPAGILPF